MLGIAVALVAWALAAAVYAARPDRAQNRRLSIVLAVEGAAWSGGVGLIYVVDSPAAAYGAQAITTVALAALPFLYLAFLASLETPLARPLRAPAVLLTLWIGAGLLAIVVASNFDQFIAGVAPASYARWEAVGGPWSGWTDLRRDLLVVISVGGLVLALDAWRRATPGTASRTRAGFYAAAFGLRDANFAWQFSDLAQTMLPFVAAQSVFGLVALVSFAILGYGILKHQLFDIDLKVKWTISKGTIGAAFVAVFFVVSESAQQLFSERAGPWIGLTAAGFLVFALAPLQRFAERVSDRAMPYVKDTDEYRTVRKREVYRAAVESALQDGSVTEKERDVLATMAEQLGLSPTEARTIEREVERGPAPPQAVG